MVQDLTFYSHTQHKDKQRTETLSRDQRTSQETEDYYHNKYTIHTYST